MNLPVVGYLILMSFLTFWCIVAYLSKNKGGEGKGSEDWDERGRKKGKVWKREEKKMK
jgi:hypothetical protein